MSTHQDLVRGHLGKISTRLFPHATLRNVRVPTIFRSGPYLAEQNKAKCVEAWNEFFRSKS